MSHPRRHRAIWRTGDSPIYKKGETTQPELAKQKKGAKKIKKEEVWSRFSFRELLERAKRAIRLKKTIYEE